MLIFGHTHGNKSILRRYYKFVTSYDNNKKIGKPFNGTVVPHKLVKTKASPY